MHARDFLANGFAVVDLGIPESEVVWLRQVLLDLVRTRGTDDRIIIQDLVPSDGPASRLTQVLEPEVLRPRILRSTAHRSARSLAAGLLDSDAADLRFFGHMMLKGPGGVAVPWHQDAAYWAQGRHRALSVWLPLADATIAGGCLHFVPGSHHGELLPHQRIDVEPGILLEAAGVREEDAIACPLRAGVAAVHDCMTLHYSGPNRTSLDRPAFIQTFLSHW